MKSLVRSLALIVVFGVGASVSLQARAQSFDRCKLWSHLRSAPQSVVRTGDFNSDGRADVVCFTRDADAEPQRGDVWVGLSAAGGSCRTFEKWHDFLCVGQEIPLTGDFNGDGKDDVVVFIRSTKTDSGIGDVGVALSDGSRFGPLTKWHEDFCRGQLVPAVGDVNGDGKDDLLAFVKSNPHEGVAEGQVYVALSRGEHFDVPTVWHDWFCIGSEVPFVADFDGDGRADLATCIVADSGHPNGGTVYVAKALAEGRFAGSTIWTDRLGRGLQDIVLDAGDINGDGKADLVAFGRQSGAAVAVLSDGGRFGEGLPIASGFCQGQEWPLVADLTGDRKVDLVKLCGEGRVGAAQGGDVYLAASRDASAASAVVVAPGAGPTPVVAVRVGEGWTFRMSELMIERGDETESEPYFIVLWFRGQLGAPGSTQVRLLPVGNLDWAANTPARVSRAIPQALGEACFGPAPVLTRAQLSAGEKPFVMGVIVAAYEHDDTAAHDVLRLAEDWRASAQQKIEMTVGRHEAGSIREAVRELSAVFGALFAEASSRLAAVSSALTDNDEYLATCGRFWYAVDPGWLQEQLPDQRADSWAKHLPLQPAHAQVTDVQSDRLSFIGGAGRHHVGWTLEEIR